MGLPIKLAAGGGVYALTTAPIAIDLSVFAGREVAFYCDEQAILFSGAVDGSVTTLVSTATAASASALVRDKAAAGFKVRRLIGMNAPFLIVATAASTGTLYVKPVTDKDASQ